jgi:pilus assembly protein CpaE
VTTDFLREVHTVLRRMFEYVIVDTPPGFTPEVITTIDNASVVCLIGMLDALSLKNVKLGVETLDLMGFPRDRIKLVLNRAGSRVGISDDDVVAIMGRKPDIFVPSDRHIPRALNEGVSILTTRPRSEAAEAFRQLAAMLTEDKPKAPTSALRRLLGRA